MAALATLEAWKDELAEKIKGLKNNDEIKPGSVQELRLQYLEEDFKRCQSLINHQQGLITDAELQEQTSCRAESLMGTGCLPSATFQRPMS
jgi:hypothetical protein